jgi:hypothetical protein
MLLTSADATAPEDFAGAIAPPAGWALISPTAIKLLNTLRYLHPLRCGTAEALAAISGLSVRAIYPALEELAACCLVKIQAKRGEGLSWMLLPAPNRLPDSAAYYYAKKLERKYSAIQKSQTEIAQSLAQIVLAQSFQAEQVFQEFKKKMTG